MVRSIFGLAVLLMGTMYQTLYGQSGNTVLVKGNTYIPLYGRDSLDVTVGDFLMHVYPVTNAEYRDFLLEFPQWQRSNVIELFADGNYLRNWESDTTYGALPANGPVTNISWFAAKAYCACKDMRLPSIDEWEYVAMASKDMIDARKEESFNQYILDWYERPKNGDMLVGSTFQNYWGLYDIHGLVWEWTYDFNSVLISGESRKDVDNDSELFCGSAAVGASDLMNYAAFMRYALRGSLKANYAMKNLGFRCVKDKKEE
jgi:formylglycine-generating enzyme required for sulfatase activity